MKNPHYNSLSSKITHATEEFFKVVQEDSKDKIPGFDFTYADLKKIIENIISDNNLSNNSFLDNIEPFFQPHTTPYSTQPV